MLHPFLVKVIYDLVLDVMVRTLRRKLPNWSEDGHWPKMHLAIF